MIPKNIFFLYNRTVNVKVSKGIHSITYNYSNCNNKLLRPNRSTILKKMEISWCLPYLYCQQRCIETQDINIIKSPFKDIIVPNTTLLEFFMESVDKHSKHIAIECGLTGRKYTFSQLKRLSQKFAVSLLKAGLKPGQVIAVITPNCPEYLIIFLGCLAAGLVISPMNHMFTSGEIYHQLNNCRASCVVSALEKLEDVNVAIAKINLSSKPEDHVNVIVLDTQPGINSLACGIGRYSELTADYVDTSDLTSFVNIQQTLDPSQTICLPYSSGTTDLPKGVQLSHNNISVNFLQLAEITVHEEATDNYQDVVPAILPFYHVYGFSQILGNSLRYGCKVVTLPKFEPNAFLNMLKNHECSVLYFGPPLVFFMGSNNEITKEHCSHIRYIVSSAAPLGASDLERCLNKIPSEVKYVQSYGMTETSSAITFPPRDVSNLSSVGAPIANTLMKVIDIESGKTLGPSEKGELCVKGPQVMLGYLNNPEAKASTIDAEGWLHTGDLDYYDDKKLFYVMDRINDLINLKGVKVPPAELEEIMRSMPGISDVGILGVPDKMSEEIPVAFIVKSTTDTVTISDVKSFMAKRVAIFKQPAEFFFVNSIPKSASGKILRREMKEMYKKLKQNQSKKI